MSKYNTKLGQLLARVGRIRFDSFVQETKAGKGGNSRTVSSLYAPWIYFLR